MLSSPWEVVAADETSASFRKKLPKLGLEVTKTYRLQKVPSEHAADPDYPAYNLVLDVAVANTGDAARRLAYRLGGPTGLPIEGEWYAIKVSRNWGSAGLRDIVVALSRSRAGNGHCSHHRGARVQSDMEQHGAGLYRGRRPVFRGRAHPANARSERRSCFQK